MGDFENFLKDAGGVIGKVTAVTSFPANAAANAITQHLPDSVTSKDAKAASEKQTKDQAGFFVAEVGTIATIAGVGSLLGDSGSDKEKKKRTGSVSGELSEFVTWLKSLVGLGK